MKLEEGEEDRKKGDENEKNKEGHRDKTRRDAQCERNRGHL
jgi:hypothetical protein